MSATLIDLPTEVEMELPVRNNNKEKWEEFGVEWLGTFENDPFSVLAKLPSGWSVWEQAVHNFKGKVFVVLDSNDFCRAKVQMGEDECATVEEVNREEALRIQRIKQASTDSQYVDDGVPRGVAALSAIPHESRPIEGRCSII